MRAHATAGQGPGTCLDERLLATLADAQATAPEQAAWVAHLAVCARCRRELAGLHRALQDERIAEALGSLTNTAPSARSRSTGSASGSFASARQWGLWRMAVVGVAAVLVVVLARGRGTPTAGDSRLRDETITVIPAPRTLTPNGSVTDVPMLRWTSVPKADLYRVTIFDAEGGVVWETETVDTTVAIPATTRLARGVRLIWRVNARAGFDRWVSSTITPFVIADDRRSP